MESRRIPTKSQNRKLSHLTAKEKLKVLNKLDEGFSISTVAHDHNLNPKTIYRWSKNRQNVEECVKRSSKSKHVRSTPNNDVNKALYIWFEEMKQRGLPVSGPMLKVKALEFHKELGGTNTFLPSEEWLNKWKENYGISHLPVVEDESSSDLSLPENFKTHLGEWIEIENLTPCQIFNAVQTCLNYKLMPNRTFTNKLDKNAYGFKKNKDRITVMPCCNADGSCRLPLLVIGKSAKPRALKNLSKDSIPVYYTSQRNSWLTTEIFHIWFNEEFIPHVTQFLQAKGLPLKALLILKNSPSLPPSEILSVDNFTIIFLPLNVDVLCQPMSHGIIANLKKLYRSLLITSLLNAQEDNIPVIDKLRSVTMKDVVFWLNEAWSEISHVTITRSWQSLLPQSLLPINCESPQEIMIETIGSMLQRLSEYDEITNNSVKDWLTNDDDLVLEESTTREIISALYNENNDVDSDEFDEVLPEVPMTAEEAETAIDCVIQFCEERNIISKVDMTVLRKIRNKIIAIKLKI